MSELNLQCCKTKMRLCQRWSTLCRKSRLKALLHIQLITRPIQCEFLNWIQDWWWVQLPVCMINTPTGLKRDGVCQCLTSGCTQLLRGNDKHQNPLITPSAVTLTLPTYCNLGKVYSIVTLIIIISNNHVDMSTHLQLLMRQVPALELVLQLVDSLFSTKL